MCSDNELVEFATKLNKQMGANLKLLLKFGVVASSKHWEFAKLLNHLQTNQDFKLITGFEFNAAKGMIWLDSLPETLKATFRK